MITVAYVRVNWQDGPAGGTPLSAANLNIMDSGIKAAHDVLDAALTSQDPNSLATKGYVNQQIPRGVIVMWSGSINQIPPGWALCDGTNGTPDLRDRFIVGAGGSYSVGSRGGTATHNLSHSHSYSGRTGGGQGSQTTSGLGGSTSIAPGHTHSYSGTTDSALGSIDNRPPYYALAFIMKL